MIRIVPVFSIALLCTFGVEGAKAQTTVTGDGDVTMDGLSVTGDGDVDLGGIKTDSEGNVTIDGGVGIGIGGVSITGDGDVDLGGVKTDSEGNVTIGDSVAIGNGVQIGLGDISVDADGGVVMPGLRVEADGSVSMGSEIDVEKMAEAMEQPGTPVNVSILFASGSADLTDKGKEQVALVAKAFSSLDEDAKVLVEGHTDSVGSDADNFALSNARSQTVVNELKLVHDVDVTLLMGGKGETSPVAENETPVGRALNRRVSFIRN